MAEREFAPLVGLMSAGDFSSSAELVVLGLGLAHPNLNPNPSPNPNPNLQVRSWSCAATRWAAAAPRC